MGEAIPLIGRVVALADAFNALTTERVYRPRRSLVMALDEGLCCSGSQLDPKVVAVFMRAYRGGRLAVEVS